MAGTFFIWPRACGYFHFGMAVSLRPSLFWMERELMAVSILNGGATEGKGPPLKIKFSVRGAPFQALKAGGAMGNQTQHSRPCLIGYST